MGWLLRKYVLTYSSKVSALNGVVVILTGGISLLIFLNGYVNMREGSYQNLILFWIGAVGASLIGCELSKFIYRLVQKDKSLKIFDEYFKSVGTNAIIYLCFNQLVIKVATHVLNSDSSSSLKKLICRLGILVITLIGLFIISQIINHIKAVKIGLGFAWRKKISWIVIATWTVVLCCSVIVADGINKNSKVAHEDMTGTDVAPALSSDNLNRSTDLQTDLQEVENGR